MICLSEKVVIRAEDLVTLIRSAVEVKWHTGMRGVYGAHPSHMDNSYTPLANNNIKQEHSIKQENNIKQENIKQEHSIKQEVKEEESNNTTPNNKYDCKNNACVKMEKPNTECPDTMYYPPSVYGGIDIREIKMEKKLVGEYQCIRAPK